ncbi:MAG: ABC transporter ATP-binding protein, partial [Candidatus Binataceae bacterium]
MTKRRSIGRFEIIRLALSFIPRSARRRWIGLIVLGLIASGLEAIAAIAVFSLIQIMLDPGKIATSRLAPYLNLATNILHISDPTVTMTVLVAAFYAAKNLFLAYALYRQAQIPVMSGAVFSRALFTAYMHAPYAYHLHKNSAEIQRNVGLSVDYVFRSVLYSLVTLLSEVLTAAGLMAVLFFIAPLTTLSAIVVLGVITYAIYRLTQGRAYRWGVDIQKLNKALLRTVNQSVGGLKEIRILGRESYFIDEFTRQRTRHAQIFALFTAAQQYPRLMLETAFVALIGLVVLASKIGIQGEGNILPLLGLYAYAGFRIMPSLNRVLISLQTIKFGAAALRDVHTDFSILASGPASGPASAAEKPMRFETELTLHGISFAYPMTERRALHDIGFSIRRGESVGIVGSTGAGKSTLLDIILGLLEPDSGELLVDGKSINNDMGQWQHLIGYVPQMVFMLDDSLKRNIALGVPDDEIDQARVDAVIRTTQLEDVVAGLPAGIDTVVGERGIRLSGGQRQRVAIARALYHRPEILVLDEATAAL